MVGLRGRRFILFVIAALAIALLAACGGDGESPSATATPTATPTVTPATSTATPSVEEEVAGAYLAYWDAYGEALLNLDASLVEGVATGEELARINDEIETLRADGVAARVVVEHDFAVVSASNGRAVVIDQFLDRSFYVDPETKEPGTSDVDGRTVRDTFQMVQRADGAWIVISSVRDR